MRAAYFIPVAVLALAVACTENSPNPVETNGNGASFSQGGNPGSPKYQNSGYSATSTNLFHTFKQVGLGSFNSVDYGFTAKFSATVQCFNKATNHVQGQPFNFTATPSDTTTRAPKNGSISTTLTLAVSLPSCGNPPFEAQLSNVSWTEIKFCWGQTNLTQGPVPETPGDGSFTMLPGATATGSPLSGGSATENAGIFAFPCQAGAAS
jgi:hypothetical protein